jgi:fluoroquinolone transport system permease protein
MVLLERDEGLHSYYTITPATVTEYILAKALSLALISATAGTIIAAAVFGRPVHFLLLFSGLFLGTPVFTLSGLAMGTAARSVNQYFVYASR